MPRQKQQPGHCYLCGEELTKTYMGRHLTSKHLIDSEGNQSRLIKVLSLNGAYWLFLDCPVRFTLGKLDSFLRNIWLECCGHMSAFMVKGKYDEIDMSIKIGDIPKGTVFDYMYDFGSTTELTVTFQDLVFRPKSVRDIRVLARNDPYVFPCEKCGKPADSIDTSSWEEPMFYCEACTEEYADEIDEDYLLPVVNSPRMGVCAYDGAADCYQYDPRRIQRA